MSSSRRTGWSALAALVLLVCGVLGLTSASARPGQSARYDALGDSYASGYGVGPYDGQCGRSKSAYAVQLARLVKVDLDDFVACAGATTGTLVSGGQLAALHDDTDLVTLQIGGNDVGWASAIAACLGGTDAQCSGALAAARAKVTDVLPARLDAVYQQVSRAAPRAKVLVVGYPRLFSPAYGAYLLASPDEQQSLNHGADLLRQTIAAAAARHGFDFVDVTKRFGDHGVNAPEPWILGPISAAPFHPDAEGYAAYTAAVAAAVEPSELP